MNRAAGSKANLELDNATESTSIPDTTLTLREYAVEAIGYALDHWERANANVPKGNRQWKEAAFFLMRVLKAHPKLIRATALQAAGVLQRLMREVPEVEDYFARDGMGPDDVVSFVGNRWDTIKIIPGESPIVTAIKMAKAAPLKITLGAKAWQLLSYDRGKFLDAARRLRDGEEVPAMYETPETVERLAVDTGLTPQEGLFYGLVLNLHDMLAKSSGQEAPTMILGCPSLAEVLGVTTQTAWEYRKHLVEKGILRKLPKAGTADRFSMNRWVMSAYLALKSLDVQHARKVMTSIDLD